VPRCAGRRDASHLPADRRAADRCLPNRAPVAGHGPAIVARSTQQPATPVVNAAPAVERASHDAAADVSRESPPAIAPGSAAIAVRRGARVALLQLFDLAPGHRLWGFGALAFGRYRWRRVPGLVFCKSLGSGFEGGFGVRPSASRQGLFCVFENEPDADRFLASSDFLAGYRVRSSEQLTVKLRVCSSRGSWSGHALEAGAPGPETGPIASLTRASIRPAAALRFWRKAPPAERALAAAPGCLLAVGLGEAPLLRQATFSLWESAAAMDAYARSGAHLEAIRAAYGERYFSESMFVRFVPVEVRGVWKGRRLG
jgi:spheroidene monooxygenase